MAGGIAAGAVAVILAPDRARAAADQSWPPFVIVAGLLMVGAAAQGDGLFAAGAERIAQLRAGPATLLLALLALVAAVTAVLNLDTSAAFLTPVLVLTARARGIDDEPFLYGSLFMANAASLLLPGSNLTNLLVLGREHVPGLVFARRMFPAWVAAVVVTGGGLALAYRRRLRPIAGDGADVDPPPPRPFPSTTSAAALALAAVLVLALRSPALPLLLVGAAATIAAVRRKATTLPEAVAVVDPGTLVAVFGVAVALGTLARTWNGPGRLVGRAGAAPAAAIGAVAAVAINNLPSAVLLTAHPVLHPRALLLGLNVGPNLAVTGSLSALIWFRVARACGAEPSAARVSRLGAVLVPLSLAAAIAASAVAGVHL